MKRSKAKESDSDSDNEDVSKRMQKPKHSIISRLKAIFGFGPKKKKKSRRKEAKKRKEIEDRESARLDAAAILENENEVTDTQTKLLPEDFQLPSAEEVIALAQDTAATIIQSIIRRFLSKYKRRRQWKEAVKAADKFIVMKVEEKKQKASNRRAGQKMFELFVKTYVIDLLQTGRVFILQNACTLKIQCLYRGYIIRKKFSLGKVNRRKRAPPKKSRITAEMARRVWARTEFEPAGRGWPSGIKHQKVLQYDMNEYADKPPHGRDFGLKTFKVVASARTSKEKEVICEDPGAWVGIPVHIEPFRTWKQRERERRTQFMLLMANTPYAEHRSVVLPKKPKPHGLELMKALGWHDGMVDKELEVVPRKSRAEYIMVNPVDSHKVADIMDGMYLPDALHKRMNTRSTGSPPPNSRRASQTFATLGGLSLDAAFSTTSTQSASLPRQKSSPNRDGWTSANINSHSFVLPSAEPSTEDKSNILSAPSGIAKATRLVTPIRGAIKPLSSAHRAALQQHQLLPEQVQKAAMRTKRQGFEDSHWKHTAWGKLKQKAEELARKEQGLEEARKLDEGSTDSLSESLQKALSADPWTRRLYRPKLLVPCRIDAFPVRTKKHFKIRYSWLPQPLVKTAAHTMLTDVRRRERMRMDEEEEASLRDDNAEIAAESSFMLTEVSSL